MTKTLVAFIIEVSKNSLMSYFFCTPCIELFQNTQMIRAVVILLTATIFIASCVDRRCGINEQFYECGSACEPKCNVPDPVVCTMQCIVNVCQCKPGYKRGPNGCRRPGPDCK